MIQQLKNTIRKTPFLGHLIVSAYGLVTRQPFHDSTDYWKVRYQSGGNSGEGSYGRLAEFKAEVLNKFVVDHNIQTVIEFGCGDGNNLALARYPSYIGLDIAGAALKMCKDRFAADLTKSFYLYDSAVVVDKHQLFRADLALSLDVLYHLVEDDLFETYMRALFNAADRYVVIYSSDHDVPQRAHVRHRHFTPWVASAFPQWRLMKKIPNRYPFDQANPTTTSSADFFLFEKVRP